MYIHLAIAEATGDEQVREFVRAVQQYGPRFADTPGFLSLHIDVEDGGRMILVTTVWQTREALLNYAARHLYRKMIAATQHLLLGSFVSKVFNREEVQ